MKKITLSKSQEERAAELTKSSMFIDSLAGTLIDPEPPIKNGESYIERLLNSGITAQSITLYKGSPGSDGFDSIMKKMYEYFNLFKYHLYKVIMIIKVLIITKTLYVKIYVI